MHSQIPRLGQKLSWLIWRGLAVITLLIVWQILSSFFLPETVLPGPILVINQIIGNASTGEIAKHLIPTFYRALAGFFWSFLLAMGVGTLMGTSTRREFYFDILILIIFAIPSLAWSILSLMWFGLNETAVIFVIGVIAIPSIAINTSEGVKSVDKDLLQMADAFDAGRLKKVWDISLPSAFPNIMAGARYGLGLSLKMTVIAEMLGMDRGVGYVLRWWFYIFNMKQVLAWTSLFAITNILIDIMLWKVIEKRLTRWR